MSRSLAAVAAAMVVVLLAACGGGSDDPEDVVRDFAEAVSSSDAEKLCHDILSEEARQQVSGATGDDAADQCEQELAGHRRGQLEILRIVRKRVEGDEATVIAEVEQDHSTGRQVYRLEKEDGDFRMTSLR